MSELYSESCNTNRTCAMETRKDSTAKLAAVALGTALVLSLVGAFNLNRDVKTLTSSQVPYIEQRIDNMAPAVIAEAKTKKGM